MRALALGALVLLCACGGREPAPAPAVRPEGDVTASPRDRAEASPEPPAPESGQDADDASADAELDAASPDAAADAADLDGGPAGSVSIGSPNYGDLRGGVALPLRGRGFVHNPRRRREARYGTQEMVDALVRAAAVVARELPGSELTINDLGFESGGPISQHGSHQAGRDVDVLFYLFDEHDAPRAGVGAPIDPEGHGTDYRDLAVAEDDLPVRIDVPRTWRFVQALIEDEGAALQRIFVVEHLRTMLLAHAREVGAPARAIERFSDMTCQPSAPHDDHFHFRFYCAVGDIAHGCEDKTPMSRGAVDSSPRRRSCP